MSRRPDAIDVAVASTGVSVLLFVGLTVVGKNAGNNNYYNATPEQQRGMDAQRIPYPEWMEQNGYKAPDSVIDGLKKMYCGEGYEISAHAGENSYTLELASVPTLHSKFSSNEFYGRLTDYEVTFHVSTEGIANPVWEKNRQRGTHVSGEGNSFDPCPTSTWLSGTDPAETEYCAMFYREGVKGLTALYQTNKGKSCK